MNGILSLIMLSTFPEFAPLSLDLKKDIEGITNQFSPYSDFNFVSLWCWDLSKKTEVSILHGNLVIRMEDYLTAEIFYMFIGSSSIYQTISDIFAFLKEKGEKQELYLIPEETIKNERELLKNTYTFEEDRDNFDYILSIDDVAEMKGKKLHQKRKLLNNFRNNYSPVIHELRISDPNIKKLVLDFVEVWKKNKGEYDSKNEEIALNNLFSGLTHEENIYILIAELKKTVIGFSIVEVLDNGYGVGDFQKADTTYKGIYEFLNYSTARFLKNKGCTYYNIEQDLGIQGLRRSKLDYNPEFFLKKYTIKNE